MKENDLPGEKINSITDSNKNHTSNKRRNIIQKKFKSMSFLKQEAKLDRVYPKIEEIDLNGQFLVYEFK